MITHCDCCCILSSLIWIELPTRRLFCWHCLIKDSVNRTLLLFPVKRIIVSVDGIVTDLFPCSVTERSLCRGSCARQHVLSHNAFPLWIMGLVVQCPDSCGSGCDVVLVSSFLRSPPPWLPPPGSLSFFSSPSQINCLHLIKDASRRLSRFCLLSPACSPLPFPSLSLLSFPLHVFTLTSTLSASHLLYRILESFCVV